MTLDSGVHRLLGDPDKISAALRADGWWAVVVPPSASTHEFWVHLENALALPDYFGRNLDALWDSLTDLELPTALVLADWTRYARARPERWAAILATLTERVEQLPAFAVVLA
ncbi:MAG TPA: barstar family protein [Propionibacteriaceae bacterium]